MEILHPCGSKAEPGSLISEVPESAILCRSSDDKHQVEKSRCDALFISVQQTDAIQVAVICVLCCFAMLVALKGKEESYSLFHAITLEKMIV